MAALARGLEVFAFVLGTEDFLEVDLGLGAASSMAKSTRGVLFFRSPSRLPSTTSFVFAIAGRWRWRFTSDEYAESERWINRGLQCMVLVDLRKGEGEGEVEARAGLGACCLHSTYIIVMRKGD